MTSRTLKTPAKLNLRLKVLGKRPDGYHELEMINIPIPLYDEVRVEILETANSQDAISFTGIINDIDGRDLNSIPNTTVHKAIAFLRDEFSFKKDLKIHIHKEIPIGGGLGGGSSDAAAVLRLLAEEGLAPSSGEADPYAQSRFQIAKRIGADVPYFLNPVPALVAGVGEQSTPLKFQLDPSGWQRALYLISPETGTSTKEVFKEIRGFSQSCRERILGVKSEADLYELIENDLEDGAAVVNPVIGEILSELRRAFPEGKISLSGSGSSIFMFALRLSEGRFTECTVLLKKFAATIRELR